MHVVYRNVRIPPGVSPGAVIGKGGQQKRQLEAESGAKVVIDGDKGTVKISGARERVDAGVTLIEELFQHLLLSSANRGHYPAPMQVLYILDEKYGNSRGGHLQFVVKDGGQITAGLQAQPVRLTVLARSPDNAVSHSLGRRGSSGPTVYTLQPPATMAGTAVAAGPSCTSCEPLPRDASAASTVDDVAATMSSLSMAPRQMMTPVYLVSQQQAAADEMLKSAERAVRHDTPKFTELKIRFNFGKHMFSKGGISDGTTWTIRQLQLKRIPQELNTRYSNMVLPNQVEKLQQFLLQQGFAKAEEKSTVSVAIQAITGAKDGKYGLSFLKHRPASPGSPVSVSLRKLKSGNSKLSFLALLAASPDQPDWRAKLLAMTHLEDDAAKQTTLRNIADAAQLVAPARLDFPDLTSHGLRVDVQRHKDKTIYQGTINTVSNSSPACSSREGGGQSTLVKVTISRVQFVDRYRGPEGVSCEVAGTCPEVNELLVKMLLSGGKLTQQHEAALKHHLSNLLAFARAAMCAAG